MNQLLQKTIRHLIRPRETTNRVHRLLQKIRRRSFRIFYSSKNGYFSQAGQDRFLNEVVFRGKKGGSFVEIGAAEGIAFSNTYFFEKELGWSGVCVEPLPQAFSKLIAARKCHCVRACVTDFSGAGVFLAVGGVPTLSGLVSKYDSRHLKRIQREVGSSGSDTRELNVRCYTFDELMQENELSAIDYLSIDTEGGELDLLKTINFERFSIEVVSVENNFADSRFEATMNKNGYELIAVIGDDDIYLRKDSDHTLRERSLDAPTRMTATP
jgi:FkbM family methyltransferase